MKNRVLFVENEPSINAIRQAFQREPYEVVSAGSNEEALSLLKQETIDVVVSDEQMPGMFSSDFTKVVHQKYPGTIQILLTDHDNLAVAMRAVNVGEAYRFFTKPFDPVELELVIHQALQHRGRMDENLPPCVTVP